jgi:hypothetical protein
VTGCGTSRHHIPNSTRWGWHGQIAGCYGVPDANKTTGRQLSQDRTMAKDSGLGQLELLASLHAEPFYAALGLLRRDSLATGGHRQGVLSTVPTLMRSAWRT